jgi:iron complex outermembrane receptor protein
VQIVAPARNLEGVMTPAVKGRMDVRTALRRLIAGTPLRIDSDDGQIITLKSSVQGHRTDTVPGRRGRRARP